MRTTILSLSFALLPATLVLAVPRPDGAPKEKPAVAEGEKKEPGFLGVSAAELPAALADQLKLDHGVRLSTVNPDSPAGKAGLEVDDILTKVGEKKVSTMLELRDAIMAHKAGDEVTLGLIQKGKPVEKKVTLVARPAVPQIVFPQGALRFAPGGLQGGNLQLDFGAGGGGGRFKMGDQDGSVEVKGEGEGLEVTVWDLSNKIEYEGPWVTPQDKAAVPPKLRNRIERVEKLFVARGNDPFQRRFVIPPEMRRPIPAPRLKAEIKPKVEEEQKLEEKPKPKVEDGELEEVGPDK